MIWNYLTVLSLGILLGWRMSRLFSQLSTTVNPPDNTATSPVPPSSASPSTLKTVSAPSPPPLSVLDSPSESAESSPAPTPEPAATSAAVSVFPPNALQLTAEMAHHLGQYKAGFLARTSHELRSPLNRVMSLQQLILADLCDDAEEEREFTRQAYAAAQELLKLLDQTTNLSKLSHGTVPLTMQSLSLMDVLAELAMQTQLHAQNRNLRLSIDLPDDDIMVMADQPCLRQVLINLVTTPIYLMQEGEVMVSHQVDPNTQMVHICIQDERPVSSWSEPIDLLQPESPPSSQPPQSSSLSQSSLQQSSENLSPSSSAWGLSLITTTQLVQLMHGTLEILETPASNSDAKTCIQCSLPLADTL